MVSGNETVIPATQFRWLRTVDESMEAMLAAIHQATHSVRLEMYIYTASKIGERFRDELVQAAQRGVRVSVLLDAWGSVALSDKFWEPLRALGGQVRWFNPLSLRRCGIRDHRKLLVCDESVAFVGGFNISTEYQGDGVTRGWYDFGLQVEGPLAEDLAGSFDTLFALADFKHRRFARFSRVVRQQIVSRREGQIIQAGPGHHPNFLKSVLLNDFKSAKSIRIIAAYFLPPRPVRRALIRAARRGARVQIILGAKSDVPLLQLAFRRFYQGFLRAGIELYEYQPQILHAKLIIADQVVYAGSANLDRRSFLANYELMLRVIDPGVVAEAEEIFTGNLPRCARVERSTWPMSRTFWNKLREWWAFFLLARVDACWSRRQLRNLR
jgi:cardiolipin synthase A/B